MVEIISRVQQLLAESKFVEAQKELEHYFLLDNDSENSEVTEIYFDTLLAQSKPLPSEKLLGLVENLFEKNIDKASQWLEKLGHYHDQSKLINLQIRIAEKKGKTEELYNLLSKYQIQKFEKNNPFIPEEIKNICSKYFPNDYQLNLQKLALELLKLDLIEAEKIIKELILSCFEKSSQKGIKDKLYSLGEVLKSSEKIYHLEIYKNFCQIYSEGIADRKDYKKVIEMVIYFEDFKFQSLLLNLIYNLDQEEIVSDYAHEVRNNKAYSYVYFDKYFNHLKKFFFQKQKNTHTEEKNPEMIDLTLNEKVPNLGQDEMNEVPGDEEILLSHTLIHQDFTVNSLLDITVSFLQSGLNLAAYKASSMAQNLAVTDDEKLKAAYLKVTCQLKNRDYRAAIDESLKTLTLCKTQNDVLSFLYSQAEAHLKLNEINNAKKILKKIVSIDANYRFAKERLEKLNAV